MTSEAAPDVDRAELAAESFRLSRGLIDAERSLLAANGIDMWEYGILLALTRGDAATQVELSRATGRDKTRLIRHLDRLQGAGLVSRRPDPADRRARVVVLTPAGAAVVHSCREAIRRMEDQFTAEIPAGDMEVFRRVLGELVRRIGEAPISSDGA